ncbi:MAG: hypothetical protein EOO05_09850 [Chitinophagaceae bacterium]|nr:MAG: hypothetical protein EOO05_09850 [Chitinophagaceae bacterium]
MLIFLDIDGVLVPAKSWQRPEILKDGFPAFSPGAVKALNQILKGDVRVVLTTSHKAHHSIVEWKNIFKERGLDITSLLTLPDNIANLNRKDEIVNWKKTNDVSEKILIIDDDKSLHELPAFLKDKWLETSSHIGLTNSHLHKMESILELQSDLTQ